MKKIICLVLMLTLMVCIPASAENLIKVTIDGKALFFDTNPINDSGRIIVPLRKIFEELNAEVTWDGETKTAISKKDTTTVLVQIDNNEMRINDEVKILDVPAQLINNRTLVPTRAVAEAFGCDVSWDQDNQTVIIKTPDFIAKNELAKEYTSDAYKISYFDKYSIEKSDDVLEIANKDNSLFLNVTVSENTAKEKITYEMVAQDKALIEQELKTGFEKEMGTSFDSFFIEFRNGIFTIELNHSYMGIPMKQILSYGEKYICCVTLCENASPEPTEEEIADFTYIAYSLIAE